MDILQIIVGAITGGSLSWIGQAFVSYRKGKLEGKLTEAQIKQISEQARKEMYDDWQEDRKFFTENFNNMSQQLFALSARVVKLESTLIKHNIPLPD